MVSPTARSPFTIYTTNHVHSNVIVRAAAAGLPNAQIRHADDWVPEPCLVYGILRGNADVIRKNIAAGLDWWHIDHGYFARGHYDGYYRLSRNGLVVSGGNTLKGQPGAERFEALGITPKSRKTISGRIIMVCPPTEYWCRYNPVYQIIPDEWSAAVVARLRSLTSLPILVREKGAGNVDWDATAAVVAHSSNILVDAMLEDVPAIATCPDHPMHGPFAALLERRSEQARVALCHTLASNQFTLEEFAAGVPWQSH